MNEKIDAMLDKCQHCGNGGFPIDNAWLAVDLDGTILENGHYPAYGPALPDAAEGLARLQRMGFKIMIWTNRMALTEINGKFQNQNKQYEDLRRHLDAEGVPYDYIMPLFHKPALVYKLIDDRAIQFKGDWGDVVGQIQMDLDKRGVPHYADKKPFLKRLIL